MIDLSAKWRGEFDYPGRIRQCPDGWWVTRRDYTHTRIQDYKALRYIRFCNARILRKQVEPQKYHSESPAYSNNAT